jgi:hypothetical protein
MPYRASRCIPIKKVALLHHTGAGFEADMAEWGRWRSAMGSEVERVNVLQRPSEADREQQRKPNCETRRGEHRGEETKEEERIGPLFRLEELRASASKGLSVPLSLALGTWLARAAVRTALHGYRIIHR